MSPVDFDDEMARRTDAAVAGHVAAVPHVDPARVDALEAETAALGANVSTIEADLLALGHRVATLESDAAALEARVATLEDTNYDPQPPPIDPEPPPVDPQEVTVDVVNALIKDGDGPQTIANPGDGSGNTVVLVATKPGPAAWDVANNDWVAPAGATPVPLPGGTYDGVSYIAGFSVWTVPDSGQLDFTFGFSGPYPQSVAAVALNAVVDLIAIAPAPTTSTSESPSYPSVAAVLDHLGLGIAVKQSSADSMTGGPSGPGVVTELVNNTALAKPRGLAIHKLRSPGATLQPGPSTWVGTNGAHVQTVLALGSTSSPPPDPGGPPAVRISTNDLVIDLDASDQATWGKNRTHGNWAVAGDLFEPGLDGDHYGLVWKPDGVTIDGSFALPDGSGIERLKPGVHNGVAIIDAASVFVDDGSYSVQPGRINTAVLTPPSDPLFHDGTRAQFGFHEQPTSVGPSAVPVVVGVSFVVQPWMQANDWTSGPFSLHSPTPYHSGPIALRARSGKIHILGRHSTTPIDPTSTGNVNGSWQGATWDLPAAGTMVTLVLKYMVDPGGAGFYEWHYLNEATGELVLIEQRGSDFGWIFDSSHPSYVAENDGFYSICQNYNWHNANPPPPNNWDPGYDVRRLQIAHFSVAQAATISVDDMAGHAKFIRGLT